MLNNLEVAVKASVIFKYEGKGLIGTFGFSGGSFGFFQSTIPTIAPDIMIIPIKIEIKIHL